MINSGRTEPAQTPDAPMAPGTAWKPGERDRFFGYDDGDTKKTILVVDDLAPNIGIVSGMMRDQDVIVEGALSGEECLEKVEALSPDLIILDLKMPGMSGIEVCKRLRENPKTLDIPVIFVTGSGDKAARLKGTEVGGDDFLVKPIDRTELLARTRNLLRLKGYHDEIKGHRDSLEEKVRLRTQEVMLAHEETLLRLSIAAEYKDDDTAAHLIRMSRYVEVVAHALGFDKRRVRLLRQAAVTHDVGKIGVPEAILVKPGKLTAEEWVLMRRHTEIGARILGGSESELLQLSERIAIAHHERVDGAGYPNGLKRDAIPMAARIVAVADVFDALTSKRPYKEAIPFEKSVQIVRDESGLHFDRTVVNAFVDALPEVQSIAEIHHNDSISTTSYVLNQISEIGER